MTFDGNMNTGLTLRTLRMQDGVAEIRAGATLLYDSDPQAEEAECRLKAAALLSAIRGDPARPQGEAAPAPAAARPRGASTRLATGAGPGAPLGRGLRQRPRPGPRSGALVTRASSWWPGA